MKTFAAAVLSSVLVVLILVSGAGAQVDVPPPVAPTKPRRITPGEVLFNSSCAGCHGANLAGGRAPSLIDDQWDHGGDDESLMRSIREGYVQNDMPAFKNTLTDAQTRLLVVYIRERKNTARGRPATTATPMVNGAFPSELHNFKLESVAEGLETPWAIAFLPDGRMLVTERPGRLRIVENGKLLPEPVAGIPKIWERQDGGMFDVEVHPDYAKNGWIYLSYSAPGPNNTSLTQMGPTNTSMTVIVRGRINNNAWVDQEFLYNPATDLYSASNIHYGSRFIFDKKGHLLYSLGDRGEPEKSQDMTSAFGKIHRVTDDGKVPSDNPYAKKKDALGTIWSYGNRNPEGLAWHPVTGKLWATEHGPRGGDEINIIAPGHNYGWPVISHGLMTDNNLPTDVTEKTGMEQPVIHYTPSPGICPIMFYTGSRFPKWKNQMFVGFLVGEEFRRFELKGDKIVKQEVLLRGHGRVRDAVTGPDGFIYLALAKPGVSVSSNTQGQVVRLVPAN